MKRSLCVFTVLCLIWLAGACSRVQSVSEAADKAAAPVLSGVYEGVLPAADCPGIHTVLTLHADGSFSKVSQYLERDARFEDKGSFSVQNNELKTTDETGEIFYYQVQPAALVQLDSQGKAIEGERAPLYVLKKK